MAPTVIATEITPASIVIGKVSGEKARPSAMSLAWAGSSVTSAGLGMSARSFQPSAHTTAPPATCTTAIERPNMRNTNEPSNNEPSTRKNE